MSKNAMGRVLWEEEGVTYWKGLLVGAAVGIFGLIWLAKS